MDALPLIQADNDFYLPLHRLADRGTVYRPAGMPDGWSAVDSSIWTQWHTAARLHGVEEGWKIHVSARIERAAAVLDVAAAVLVAEGVPFKHLSCSQFFVAAHHKHAHRPQSGKFIAAYPPDQATAGRVMTALAAALDGERGASVLTDRRYRDSDVVHYRFGSYVPRKNVRADGTYEFLVRDVDGNDVPDRRGASFTLPAGRSDPFADTGRAADYLPVPDDFTPVVNGFEITRVIGYSNGGGTYAGVEVATGRPVFIKEARAHNGLSDPHTDAQVRLRHEYDTLRAVHQVAPGVCPEPLSHFRLWEHDFMVTEFVPGRSLHHWMAANSPLVRTAPTATDLAGYLRRATLVLDRVAGHIRRLHEVGYVFFDINPFNVLVDDDGDAARLVDFEFAGPVTGPQVYKPAGAPGHTPPFGMTFTDRRQFDEYGLSALALYLMAPLNNTAQREPGAVSHLRYELDRIGMPTGALWERATRAFGPAATLRPVPVPAERAPTPRTARGPRRPPSVAIPGPRQVADDPVGHLRGLRDGLVRGLLDVALPDDPDGVFPLGPQAYATNSLGVAHGLAGVLHALSVADVPVPAAAVRRLIDDTVDAVDDLAPGLLVGSSGIAWVLAGLGYLDEAEHLLKHAGDHPLLRDGGAYSATLGYGAAGVGLTQLYVWERTGDDRHLDRALALAATIPDHRGVADRLGPDNATGWASGRPGPALLLHYLGRLTGDPSYHHRGVAHLVAELGAGRHDGAGTLFPVSDLDRRTMPYLFTGGAGFAFVAGRYLAVDPDTDRPYAHHPEVAAVLPSVLATLATPHTAYAGLATGMAGLGLVQADHALRHGTDREPASDTARRLIRYLVAHGPGVHVLGEYSQRISCDLSGGSAGVLLFLDSLLERRRDTLFTLDALCDGRRQDLDHRDTTGTDQPIDTRGGDR